MANFSRRLRKLEAQILDNSGLVPHSRKWLDYWERRFDRFRAGEHSVDLSGMPIELFRSMLQALPADDGDEWQPEPERVAEAGRG
jgi:hypothetical protein